MPNKKYTYQIFDTEGNHTQLGAFFSLKTAIVEAKKWVQLYIDKNLQNIPVYMQKSIKYRVFVGEGRENTPKKCFLPVYVYDKYTVSSYICETEQESYIIACLKCNFYADTYFYEGEPNRSDEFYDM